MKNLLVSFASCLIAVTLIACSSSKPSVNIKNEGNTIVIDSAYGKMDPFVFNSLRRDTRKTDVIDTARAQQIKALSKGDVAKASGIQTLIDKVENKASNTPATPNRQIGRSYSSAQEIDPVETRSIRVSNQTAHQARLTKLGVEIAPGKTDTLEIQAYEKNLSYKLTSKGGKIWSKIKKIAPDQTDLVLTQ